MSLISIAKKFLYIDNNLDSNEAQWHAPHVPLKNTNFLPRKSFFYFKHANLWQKNCAYDNFLSNWMQFSRIAGWMNRNKRKIIGKNPGYHLNSSNIFSGKMSWQFSSNWLYGFLWFPPRKWTENKRIKLERKLKKIWFFSVCFFPLSLNFFIYKKNAFF